jgi:hypothetical protein
MRSILAHVDQHSHPIADIEREPPDPARLRRPAHTVHAICVPRDHIIELDLHRLIAQGHGDVPLIKLPLRCSQCGKTGHKISVSGRSYPFGLRFPDA